MFCSLQSIMHTSGIALLLLSGVCCVNSLQNVLSPFSPSVCYVTGGDSNGNMDSRGFILCCVALHLCHRRKGCDLRGCGARPVALWLRPWPGDTLESYLRFGRWYKPRWTDCLPVRRRLFAMVTRGCLRTVSIRELRETRSSGCSGTACDLLLLLGSLGYFVKQEDYKISSSSSIVGWAQEAPPPPPNLSQFCNPTGGLLVSDLLKCEQPEIFVCFGSHTQVCTF